MTSRSALMTAAVFATLSAQPVVEPARFEAGPLPPLPALAVGGGQVILQVHVGADGRVASTRPLRTTPPFAGFVTDAVTQWRFVPAYEVVEIPGEPARRTQVPSDVLVIALFRPPSLFGPTIGEELKEVGAAPASLPFPMAMANPGQSPLAYNPGVVLLEVRVNAEGTVTGAGVIRSAPPYDDAALSAVRQWTFRPARQDGRAVAALLYVLVGFPTPVTAQ